MTEGEVKVYKVHTWYGKLLTKDGLSAKCPICGVISNLFLCYKNSGGTSVNQSLGYCGHNAEGYFEIREQL